jgi:hypothetical protein
MRNTHVFVHGNVGDAMYGKHLGNFHRELRLCWQCECDQWATEAASFVPEKTLVPLMFE